MGLLKLLFTGLLIFGFQFFCWAQISLNEIQIWFEETKESDAISITTNFLSEAEDLVVLSYEVAVKYQQDGIEKTLDIEKGEFLAAQNLPMPLSTKTIRIGTKQKITLTLNIFQGQELLVEEKYIWEKEELKKTDANIVGVEIQKKSSSKLNQKQTKPSTSDKLAQSDKPLPSTKKRVGFSDAIEIQGLIIDETRSKIGRDFYEIFFRKWIPPRDSDGDFIIKIKELPSFGRGSRITLEVNDQSLGIRNLSPRFDYVELQVNASIRQVRAYLSQKSKISNDLENEDASGSGIF